MSDSLFLAAPSGHVFKVHDRVRANGVIVAGVVEVHECGAVKVAHGPLEFWTDRMFLEVPIPGAFDRFKGGVK